jgi:hypothetical protein
MRYECLLSMGDKGKVGCGRDYQGAPVGLPFFQCPQQGFYRCCNILQCLHGFHCGDNFVGRCSTANSTPTRDTCLLLRQVLVRDPAHHQVFSRLLRTEALRRAVHCTMQLLLAVTSQTAVRCLPYTLQPSLPPPACVYATV